MYVSVTSLTLVQGKVMGMLLDFFPLLIQRCAALLRVREKNSINSFGLNIDDNRGQGYDNGSNMKGKHKGGSKVLA